jgi:hypothetical protein
MHQSNASPRYLRGLALTCTSKFQPPLLETRQPFVRTKMRSTPRSLNCRTDYLVKCFLGFLNSTFQTTNYSITHPYFSWRSRTESSLLVDSLSSSPPTKIAPTNISDSSRKLDLSPSVMFYDAYCTATSRLCGVSCSRRSAGRSGLPTDSDP